MSITLVETYIVKSDKRPEFKPLLDEFLAFKNNHPDLFVGLLSWKLYKQDLGSPAGMYIEMWEFQDMELMEKVNERVFRHEGMKTIQTAFQQLVEPISFTSSIWRPIA
jgi:hypothetical protein